VLPEVSTAPILRVRAEQLNVHQTEVIRRHQDMSFAKPVKDRPKQGPALYKLVSSVTNGKKHAMMK